MTGYMINAVFVLANLGFVAWISGNLLRIWIRHRRIMQTLEEVDRAVEASKVGSMRERVARLERAMEILEHADKLIKQGQQ